MIQQLKTEFETIATALSSTFKSLDATEYEDFVQEFDFDTGVLINLEPIKSFRNNIDRGGVVRFNANIVLTFMDKFQGDNDLEDVKDALIDQMIDLSENFFKGLDKNERFVFISPQWTWNAEIIRQYTANLLCGVRVNITLDTACNRI